MILAFTVSLTLAVVAALLGLAAAARRHWLAGFVCLIACLLAAEAASYAVLAPWLEAA